MSDLAHCHRCRRPTPRGLYDPTAASDDPSFDEPGFAEWEPVVDESGAVVALVCGGCMTQRELGDLADDFAEGVG